LRSVAGARDLSPTASQIFANPANEIFLSAVSAWELSVKHALGKLPLPSTLDRFVAEERARDMGSHSPAERTSRVSSAQTSQLHRDPFDRMLICQAIEHDCVLLTPDPLIVQYPVRTRW
jgi:PIN domain nuclease of toxin-antitoxin system